ncbi:MAG: 50S ribosome-binding GTPase, partial [Planctomycetes bacterium]|nr:50S ribosome-binding GTPase [Planctomycetota bacterium]
TAGRCWFGKLGLDAADDVLLAVKPEGVEVHCHGGVQVVRMIEELYAERGVRVVSWQECADPLLDLLVRAPTTRTAAILLDQWQGAWERLMNSAPSTEQRARLAELIPLGQHLVEPWKVAIAGAPNVGKSSLMNALAGFARSIVSPMPGTTRDLVSVQLAIDGWPVEMTDTAGIRAEAGGLERQGIQRALDAVRQADLRLWLLDGSTEPAFPKDPDGWSLIINKIDLPPAWDWKSAGAVLRVSARTGEGVPELCALISRTLVPTPPAPGEAVPCLPAQVDSIRA